jgi:hypothetical protein
MGELAKRESAGRRTVKKPIDLTSFIVFPTGVGPVEHRRSGSRRSMRYR